MEGELRSEHEAQGTPRRPSRPKLRGQRVPHGSPGRAPPSLLVALLPNRAKNAPAISVRKSQTFESRGFNFFFFFFFLTPFLFYVMFSGTERSLVGRGRYFILFYFVFVFGLNSSEPSGRLPAPRSSGLGALPFRGARLFVFKPYFQILLGVGGGRGGHSAEWL